MNTMNIEITESAKTEFAKLPTGDNGFLRISVVEGGCSGRTYSATVESDLKEDDEILFEDADMKVVADPGSAIFLTGLKIDYSDDLVKAGFRFINPNASGACGCGSSFS